MKYWKQYFSQAGEMIAVDAVSMREISENPSITNALHVPDFMRAVIISPGCVAPVIDPRLKFAIKDTARNDNTCNFITKPESKEFMWHPSVVLLGHSAWESCDPTRVPVP